MAVLGAQEGSWTRPTRWSALVFAAKVWGLRFKRALGRRDPLHRRSDEALPHLLAQSRTPLFGDLRAEERGFQLGKIENLKRAAQALDGLMIPAGQTFSFWRQVGRPGADRGFVVGRMLSQGCLIPSVGGGLCQLSNALYQAGREAGLDIVERHAHSRAVPGSAAEVGADATVAWNYVDLRLRPAQTVRLEARVDGEALVVAFSGAQAAVAGPARIDIAAPVPIAARTCSTCDETACFRHKGSRGAP